MRSRRIIEAREIVRDVRDGMSDAELMKKYNLSSKGLQSAFQKLVDNRIMTVQELYGQRESESGDDTMIIYDMRQLPRYLLTVVVPVYDDARPQQQGMLRDITEKGIGITGIQARIGEIKTLAIVCGEYFGGNDIRLEAECRWVEHDPSGDSWQAGFQIIKISKENLVQLRRLVGTLTLDTRSAFSDEDLE
ncbi:MAG: PilZ domain-containing protein [Desulfomonile tiedjei]|uniref:PilZ domain-containing protein n=1 Tax=Desulfomonile tiedjei TaxID=2358 RepID=A0A9D6V4Y5_9BACT|nr:PilZ domain-containing protein [Desulfomonile tiedjei]